MKNDFTLYLEAFALKELGFDEPCYGLFYGVSIKEEPEFLLEDRSSQYSAEKGYVDAVLSPTYSQAFRWFRGNYNIDGWVVPYLKLNSEKTYDYIISGCDYDEEENEFNSYEEAETACLKTLIKIIEKQKL